VVFADDTETSLQAAVTLVNTADEPDTLTTVAELDAWYATYLYTGRHDRTRAELDQVRALRAPLRSLFTADRAGAVELVNAILRERDAVPQLVIHDHWDFHLHATKRDDPLVDRIAVETAMAMVDVIRSDELTRFSICADETCESVVLDLSRNRSRIYCSTTCGNRNAVAAYRARQS
jgi:predicted RNA-binding Zn ribbon-like protein